MNTTTPSEEIALNPFALSELYRYVLIFRWISLVAPLWWLQHLADTMLPPFLPGLLLLAAVISTLLFTLPYILSSFRLFNAMPWLAIDGLVAAMVVTFSTNLSPQPFMLYTLSVLVGTTYLMPTGRFERWWFPLFVTVYALFTVIVHFWFAVPITVFDTLLQLGAFGLVVLITGKLLRQNRILSRRTKQLLTRVEILGNEKTFTQDGLIQCETIQDLTLLLQGAHNRFMVQQRLLHVLTNELGFSLALVGLIDPLGRRVEAWEVAGDWSQAVKNLPPLIVQPQSDSIVVKALLTQRVSWPVAAETLLGVEAADALPGHGQWLVMPLIWQDSTAGVLAVALDPQDQFDLSDERGPILTALASQAAVALSTLTHSKQLHVEQERNRIARDMHDTVAQSLFGAVFSLDACIKMLPTHPVAARNELLNLRQTIDDVRQDVRQSILNIWPSELTAAQFEADLAKYITHAAGNTDFDINFNIQGDFDGLSALVRRTLYRVSQEAIANIIQHAGVDTARLVLLVEPDQVQLSIRDHGSGFDPRQALAREQNREHFGLKGIKERIEGLHGVCDILSQPGQGSQILIRLPHNGNE